GIGGPVTYPRNNYLRDLLQYIPSDRLLVETDCPYLPPQGKRGKRNEPSFIVEVVNTISTMLNRDFAEISNITFRNGIQAFGIEAEMW
ncbi:MAG: TatD family hydrolase, partial [Bacillota bacterium]